MRTRIYRLDGGWAFWVRYRQGEPVEGWSPSREGAVFGRAVAVGQAAGVAERGTP